MMTKAEKDMVLFFIDECGLDYCKKCIHAWKESCCCYASPDDYSGECNDDYSIDGMVKYFEKKRSNKKQATR